MGADGLTLWDPQNADDDDHDDSWYLFIPYWTPPSPWLLQRKTMALCNIQKIFDDEKQSSSNRYRFSAAGKKNRFTDTIISWMMELLTRKCQRLRLLRPFGFIAEGTPIMPNVNRRESETNALLGCICKGVLLREILLEKCFMNPVWSATEHFSLRFSEPSWIVDVQKLNFVLDCECYCEQPISAKKFFYCNFIGCSQ